MGDDGVMVGRNSRGVRHCNQASEGTPRDNGFYDEWDDVIHGGELVTEDEEGLIEIDDLQVGVLTVSAVSIEM